MMASVPALAREAVRSTGRARGAIGAYALVRDDLEQYTADRARSSTPLFNLRTCHFLRSSDFVRVPVGREIELCVATLRGCNHRSFD